MESWIVLYCYCAAAILNIGRITTTQCPDADPELRLWSDSETWTLNGLPEPFQNATVTIKSGMKVKLDADVDVNSIVIETNGRLVWDSSRDSIVRTHFIYIRGTMEIGSENCKFKKKAKIILKGIRGENPGIPQCGEKFICVDQGGTLELHGRDKLSWTKLTKTVTKLSVGQGLYFKHQESENMKHDWREGLRVYEMDPSSPKVYKEDVFYLSGQMGWWTDKGLKEIGPFINSKPDSAKERLDNSAKEVRIASVSMDFQAANQRIEVLSRVGSPGDTHVDFIIYEYDRTYPIIDVVDNVHSWEPGDRVLLTSTDFDMDQAEEGIVQFCQNCNQKQIGISLAPRYTHWSKMENNIDMRGEVALLTRNIKILGEMEMNCHTANKNCKDYAYDTFGGQIQILRNFKNVHIEGVELENVGQATEIGNYPLHFHMCYDTDDGNYPNPPYLRRNSIYRAFARCIAIHGSHGITIEDNVCYDTLGHSIFLEDGGEKRTVIDGNLVASTRKGKLIASDSTPASFWITNPLTVIRNNVAAGSVEDGFWIIFPDEPTGSSESLGFMKKYEAKHTKMTEISNNVAHSNLVTGFFMDGTIQHNDLKVYGVNGYYPRTIPTDPNNKYAEDDPVYINKMTCWKNRIQNSWIRGGFIVLKHYSSADSGRGLIFARSSKQEQFIEYSVIVGETDNIGEPTKTWNNTLSRPLAYPRSLAVPWDNQFPIIGLIFYDGPVYADKIWFNDFKSTENYTSAAIGFRRRNQFSSSAGSSMTDILFGFDDPLDGNRVYDGNTTIHGFGNLDGDKGATFRDEDGSVTSYTSSKQIVKPGRFYTTSDCTYRSNWNMAVCPHIYGKLDVDIDRNSPDRGQTEAIMLRDDEPDFPVTLSDDYTADFLTILGGSHSYTLHWTKQIPRFFIIRGYGIEKHNHVRLGICLPIDATFNLYTWSPLWRPETKLWTQVLSLKELDNDTLGDRYFWDKSIGMLFVKFVSYRTRSRSCTTDCEGECPVLQVTILSGDRADGNCRHRTYVYPGTYRKPSSGKMKTDEREMTATSNAPPVDWGAGSQLPFSSRQITDGGFSDWSDYMECSVTCGGGTKSRYRYCNNPSPTNGGADCAGRSVLTLTCNDKPCPIDGGFADWTSWSTCLVTSGCQGSSGMWVSAYFAVLVYVFVAAATATVTSCPDDDVTLKPWSVSTTWTNQGLQVPSTNSDVTIQDGMNVKLDVDLDVNSITIETNGRLVWDSGKNTVIRTRYILIQGTVEIGSEDCKFNAKTEIILKGIRNEIPDVGHCGQKFICVAQGGTLELHGKDKLSWTKLDKTVNPLKVGDGIFYQHQKTSLTDQDWFSGLRVYEFDASSKQVIKTKVFYLSGQNEYFTNKGLAEIGPFIDSISAGSVVGIALLRTLVGTADLSDVYDTIESLGASRIRDVDNDDAYTFIVIKGDTSSAVEDLNNSAEDVRVATVSMDFIAANQKIVSISQVKTGSWGSTYVDFLVYDHDRAYPTIDLFDNAQTLEPDDKILFTSTDFDMEQAEVGSVVTCNTCSQKQVRADFVPKFVHWSKLENNVDMRGEVALLTRNIKVRGETQLSCPASNGNCADFSYDTFGGHVKVLRYFKNVHVEGVELENMGQATSLGNYPLHFHMCHDTDDENYPNPPYLRKNSIHHSFARCITVHGSHGVTVQDNVCYDHLCHGIFLEDGGEKRTVIDGNLVAVTRKCKLIHSDGNPASYWITNPKTIIRNNVAAGSEGMGFWIIFPDIPTGPSESLGFMAFDEARHTKITEMSNNAAHSNDHGLFIDNRIKKIGNELKVEGTNGYYPRTMPLDPKNPLAEDDPVYIDYQTCWKNRENTWIRGGLIFVRWYSSADSGKGLTFARSSDQEQFIEKSVFMGETDNIGEPTEVWSSTLNRLLGYPRSLVIPWDDKYPIQGFIFYDGPVYAESIWFDKFTPTTNYTSGALSFLRNNRFSSSSVSHVMDIKYGFVDPTGGNRVYDGDETVHGFNKLDGDKSATCRDQDGSVTNLTPNQQIVKPGRFYTTASCQYRSTWKMAMCPHKYAKLDVNIDNGSLDRGQTNAIMVRDDEPNSPETLADDQTAQFMAILGGTYSYTLHWSNNIPNIFWIYTDGVELNQFVRVGMCMPPDATFNLYSWSPLWRPKTSDWTEVSSITDLDADTVGDRYFWDSSNRMLFVKFISYNQRTTTSKNCEGSCPMLKVVILSGDRSNGECRDSAYTSPGTYKKPSSGQMSTDSRTLAATAQGPPQNWGAGSQLPFTSRQVINGGWSSWSSFNECSVTCGGGTKTQYKTCNNPSPANGGADCAGNNVNTVTCNDDPCAVDGGFGEWGSWSSCMIPSSCQGYRESERFCNNPTPHHGGLHCTGPVKKQEACNTCP
ncbi:uncharacterized protein LOC134718239 [Mytilus trossulus]|uniref:uncharacterized protein LOC134718239 n=1 Tax=Mytilus trossulus TaxID=6551 RepID=UPI0030077695